MPSEVHCPNCCGDLAEPTMCVFRDGAWRCPRQDCWVETVDPEDPYRERTCTALALRPREQVIEFRRCTGHCCDPVQLDWSPGELRKRALLWGGDDAWIAKTLIYLGWRPADGAFLYRCRHFDDRARACKIHGGQRPWMCTRYPEYRYGLWTTCGRAGCTRRTMVLRDGVHIRWRFPDLWRADLKRWDAFESRVCRPEYGPEAMPAGSEL